MHSQPHETDPAPWIALNSIPGLGPAKLAALCPTYLKQVPKDRFTDGELIYKRKSGGYVLYSLGSNLKDDGGTVDGDWRRDDVVVQTPKRPQPHR